MELPVDVIEPNEYNPNVLKGEKYEALKKDVKAGRYDPILVSPKHVFYGEPKLAERYIIVDGEWRWRAAVEEGLKKIKVEVRSLKLFEAKTITFKKNRQRGNLDPFKEATLFNGEVEGGLTEKEVADRYSVSRSYVAGRRSLLKISDEVKELSASPEKTLKKRLREKIRQGIEEEPSEEVHTEEEIDEYVEREVGEVVPRGTLTPGHLKALSSLPAEYQAEIAEEIVHNGLTVRGTEENVQRTHELIEAEKRFKEALEKARQPNCPSCGAPPKGFHFSSEQHFQCSRCYNSWDYMVTKEELKQREREQKKATQTERSKQIKQRIKNPRYIRRKEPLEELERKIRGWVLLQVGQLTEIEKIEVIGARADGEKVNIDFPGSWGKGLSFYLGKKGEHDFWYNWRQQFSIRMEAKAYKTVDAKTKIDLYHNVGPVQRVQVHRFFDEIVNTDKDPFLSEQDMKKELFEEYGEELPKKKKKES